MDDHPSPNTKVLSLDQLLKLRAQARLHNEPVVQCHGCFDIVHPGHIRHLRSAAAQGKRLLVSITADRFVNKGAGRPVFTEDLRADNLAALSFVDWVYVNDQETASALLTRTQPDVFIKGAEYELNEDPRFAEEREVVERAGGRVVFSSSDVVFSSSALVEQIPDNAQGDPVRARLRLLSRDHDLSLPAMEGVLERIAGKRIIVVGETIIDTYIRCTWPEVSSESPVLSLRPIERTRYDGGCAVIAQHLAAIGAEPVLITPLPPTAQGEGFRERMGEQGVEVHAVEGCEGIPAKDRYLVGREKMVKVDHPAEITLDTGARARMIGLVGDLGLGADACILGDYGLGMFTPKTLRDAALTARERCPLVTGDVSGRRSSLRSMHAVDLLTPSENELRMSVQDFDSSLPAVVWKILEETGARSIAATLDEEGVIVFTRGVGVGSDQPEVWSSRLVSVHVPSFARIPIDTLGCGDALLAVTTAAMSTGCDPCRSVVLGSLAAGIQSAAMGNPPVRKPDLLRALHRQLAPGSTFEPKSVLAPTQWT